MNTKPMARTAAAAAALALAAAFAVGCSHAKQAGSAASSAASAGVSAASSVATGASSAVSSVVAGAPTTSGEIGISDVPGVGNVTLDAPTAAKYQDLGGAAVLGAPTGQPEKVGDGTAQAFANGTIYSSPSTGAHLVSGEILRVYTTVQGGPTGTLGWPTTDEAQTGGGPNVANGGWISDFEHGSISWLNQGDGVFKETVTQK